MRQLVEATKGRRVDATDGIKAYHGDDWALVIPDTVEPATHLWAEAGSEAEARALADEYEALIRRVADGR
jgi:phosphomannomutase